MFSLDTTFSFWKRIPGAECRSCSVVSSPKECLHTSTGGRYVSRAVALRSETDLLTSLTHAAQNQTTRTHLPRPWENAQVIYPLWTLLLAGRPSQREGKQRKNILPNARAAGIGKSSRFCGGRVWSLISPCRFQQHGNRIAVVLYWRQGRISAALRGQECEEYDALHALAGNPINI